MTSTLDTRPNNSPEDALDRATGSVTVHPTTLGRVITSEWIKLRTLRSTWIGLASFVLILVGVGAVAAAVSTGSVSSPRGGGGQASSSDPLSTVLTGANLAVLLIAVLGCLAGAREYGSGMITATVTAVPRRWHIVVGKASVLAAVVFPAALLATFAAYGAGMSILSASGAATVSLTDSGVLLSLVGMACYLTAIALLGLALGVLLRSVASSIGMLIAGILILPSIAGALLPDSWGTVLQYLPNQAAGSFTAVGSSGTDTLGATAGALVLAGWVVVALAAAVLAIKQRDV
jgi:ABC-2 type transport system permease protein